MKPILYIPKILLFPSEKTASNSVDQKQIAPSQCFQNFQSFFVYTNK